jgi:hypothetical protein
MPEELALEERRCKRRAVADDEGFVLEGTQNVERPRNELLARATLSGHQCRCGVPGQALEEGKELEHRLALRYHSLEDSAALQLLLENAGAMLQTMFLEHRRHDALEAPEIDRLFDVIGSAEPDRLDGIFDRRVGRHEHELDVWVALLEATQELETAHTWHSDV